jgi:hypothetical protein
MDFEKMQTWAYNDVLETLGAREVFAPRNVIKSDGWRLCCEVLVSEENLIFHLEYGVEKPAERIMQAMQESGLSRFDLNDKGGIVFEHRGDGDDRLPQASAIRNNSNKTLLFYIQGNHKMTPENLRVGLRQPDFWEKVINRREVPGDMSEQLMYNAEYLTGTALAQAYDIMVHRGTPYGVLATGSCLVFLHVSEDDPETLYYFLSEPILDVQAMINRGDTNWMKKPVTAVGRLLALSLMSTFLEPNRDQSWISRIMPRMNMLPYDFTFIFTHISREELMYAPPASGYKASGVRRAPSPESPTRRHRVAPIGVSLEFCTAECLLGLQRKGELDQNCPNVGFHQSGGNLTHHQIDSADMVRLLKLQLDRDLQQYCHLIDTRDPDEIMKGWGVLFKLTLMPYGYTVAGKGSVEEGWTHGLCKEEKIYRLLQPVQGSDTPVFLGSLHLDRHYVFERAWINHFLLLSWGGQGLEFNTMTKDRITAYREALRNIRACGVDTGYVPYQNLLWSVEQGIQIIGFRSATTVEEWQELGKRKKRNRDEAPAKRQRM